MGNEPLPPDNNITKEIDKIGINVVEKVLKHFASKIKSKFNGKVNKSY